MSSDDSTQQPPSGRPPEEPGKGKKKRGELVEDTPPTAEVSRRPQRRNRASPLLDQPVRPKR